MTVVITTASSATGIRYESLFIASVAFFPERYGDGLIRLASDILRHRQTPPALFVRHHVITPENVDHYYPNDTLLGQVAAAGTA